MHANGKILEVSTTKKPADDFHRDLGKYLDEMGVSRELLATMERVPAGLLQNLKFSEIAALKLMTEHGFVASLATNAMCQSSPPADNCIKR